MKKAINITQEILSKNPHLGSLGIKVFTDSNFPKRFNGVENVGGYYINRTDLHEQDGFWEVERLPLGENQKYGSIQRKGTENLYHYPIIDLTEEEIQSRIISNSEANRQAIIDETIRKENEASVDATFQAIEDDEVLLENIDAFPLWTVGETYLLNKKIKYVVNGEMKLFKVNQPTLTADILYPPGSAETEALYTEVFQPTDGQQYEVWTERTAVNASEYSIGKIVWYPEIDTQLWISKINSNTTVPDGDVPYNRYWEPYNP